MKDCDYISYYMDYAARCQISGQVCNNVIDQVWSLVENHVRDCIYDQISDHVWRQARLQADDQFKETIDEIT